MNLNTASQGELEKLPCIGPKKAQDIIKGRQWLSTLDLRTEYELKDALYSRGLIPESASSIRVSPEPSFCTPF